MSERRGCGCLLLCIGITAALTIAVVGLLYGAFWYAVEQLDTEPQPLPVPEVSVALEDEIRFTERTFRNIVDEGAAGELVLSEELLNGWLRLSPSKTLRFIGEHSWIELAQNSARARVSLPMEPLGIEGRFFNAELDIRAAIENGTASFVVDKVKPLGHTEESRWIAWLLSERDLVEPLSLTEMFGQDIVERCSVAVKDSAVALSCREQSSPVDSLTSH